MRQQRADRQTVVDLSPRVDACADGTLCVVRVDGAGSS